MFRLLGAIIRHNGGTCQVVNRARSVVLREKIRFLHKSALCSASHNDDLDNTKELQLQRNTEELSERQMTDHEIDAERKLHDADSFGNLADSTDLLGEEKHQSIRTDVTFNHQKEPYTGDAVNLRDRKGSNNRPPYSSDNSRNKKFKKPQFDNIDDFFERRKQSQAYDDNDRNFNMDGHMSNDRSRDGRFNKRNSGGSSSDVDHFEKRGGKKLADQFGLLSADDDEVKADLLHDEMHDMDTLQEEREDKPHIPLGQYNRKHIPDWYGRRILKLGQQGKVKEAINVFDKWMIMEDRVKPTVYEFELLIQILGKVGYTSKAFKLYNQMVKLGVKDFRSPHIYTSLFNACSNSPWPENGLKRARKLRNQMLVREYKPSYITYNSMIKAFGMCGDLNTAFLLADEAAQTHRVTSNLLSSLLIACITDKESGFRHAILVWRKMKQMGVNPDRFSYNLLMRAVNECGIGTPELAEDILIVGNRPQDQLKSGPNDDRYIGQKAHKVKDRSIIREENKKKKLFADIDELLKKYTDNENSAEMGSDEIPSEGSTDTGDTKLELQNSAQESKEEISLEDDITAYEKPDNIAWWQMDIFTSKANESSVGDTSVKTFEELNVLDPNTNLTQGLSLDKVKSSEDRLALIGGYSKILHSMQPNIKPDITFFTQCMQAVPAVCEEDLMNQMYIAKVKPDVTFLNLLMKKRAHRKDIVGAQSVLKLFQEFAIVPDILTFGCYAECCRTKQEGLQLLKSMERANIEPNGFIMSTLLFAAKLQFGYMINILFEMERYSIRPTKKTIQLLESKISFAKKVLAAKEKDPKDYFDPEAFAERLDKFISIYDKWLKRMEIATEDHPWAAFTDKKDKEDEVEIEESQKNTKQY